MTAESADEARKSSNIDQRLVRVVCVNWVYWQFALTARIDTA
jgi:hypothetical protein